jgi:hypothetical protein
MPQALDSEKIQVQPQVEWTGGETAFSIYVNNTEMGLSAWDLRIRVGEILGQKPEGNFVVKNHGTIVMAPAHAKAFLEALQTTVAIYEEKFGEIDLSRIKAVTGATFVKPTS